MGVWAREAQIDLDVIRPDREPLGPESVLGFDGLVVLGGAMGNMDTDRYPWLEDVRETLRIATRHDLPTLGICLGAQLLAASLGGTVAVGGAGMEAGAVEITTTPEARDDPLLGGLPSRFSVGAMHGDEIHTLPPGAAWLATSPQYPHQAFRSRNSWGVQFHPEVSPDRYDCWTELAISGDPDRSDDLRRIATTFRREYPVIEAVASRFFHSFFEVVSRHP